MSKNAEWVEKTVQKFTSIAVVGEDAPSAIFNAKGATFFLNGQTPKEGIKFDMVWVPGSKVSKETIDAWKPFVGKMLCGDGFFIENGKRQVAEALSVCFKRVMAVMDTDIWRVEFRDGKEVIDLRREGVPRVFIGSPVYKEAHPRFMESVVMSGEALAHKYDIVYGDIPGDAMVDRARANLLGKYLANGPFDFFVGIDSDISWHPSTLDAILSRMIESQAEHRDNPKQAIHSLGALYAYKTDPPAVKAGTPVLRALVDTKPDDTGLWEVEWQGGGFYVISDYLMQDLMRSFPELKHYNHSNATVQQENGKWTTGEETWALWLPMVKQHKGWDDGKCEYVSEDYAFMERIRMLGYKNYVDAKALCGHHVGDKVYTVTADKLYDEDIIDCTPDMAGDCAEIFGGAYDVPLDGEGFLILDAGACFGAFSLWASWRWPNSNIMAYEPNPDALKYTKNNVNKVADGSKINLIEAALSDHDGTTLLRKGDTLGCVSMYDIGRQRDDGYEVEVIDAARLPSFDIVKIDTEGSEVDILSRLNLENTKAVMLEYHRGGDVDKIDAILTKAGLTQHAHEKYNNDLGILRYLRK